MKSIKTSETLYDLIKKELLTHVMRAQNQPQYQPYQQPLTQLKILLMDEDIPPSKLKTEAIQLLFPTTFWGLTGRWGGLSDLYYTSLMLFNKYPESILVDTFFLQIRAQERILPDLFNRVSGLEDEIKKIRKEQKFDQKTIQTVTENREEKQRKLTYLFDRTHLKESLTIEAISSNVELSDVSSDDEEKNLTIIKK